MGNDHGNYYPRLLQRTCDHINEYLYTGKGDNSNIAGTLGHRALLNIDTSRLEVSSWFPIRGMVYAGQVIIRVFRSMLIICTVLDYIMGNTLCGHWHETHVDFLFHEIKKVLGKTMWKSLELSP